MKECEQKFANAIKYYTSKIDRKFNKAPLRINDVSIDEGKLKTLQETIIDNTNMVQGQEKRIKKHKSLKRLGAFFAILSFVAAVGLFVVLLIKL